VLPPCQPLEEEIFRRSQVLGAPDRAETTLVDRLNLERAVSQMPAGYKQIFLLPYVEGYGHREIARMPGLSIGTSKAQLYKARDRLRRLLRGKGSPRWHEGVSRRLHHVTQTAGRKSKRSRGHVTARDLDDTGLFPPQIQKIGTSELFDRTACLLHDFFLS